MAGHQLIDGYLAELATQLPPDTVDELADGLIETWQHHLRLGENPDHAAQAAVAEFGTTQQVTDAFVVNASGRRTARFLLATGPIMAVCWGASLIAAKAWTWPLPRSASVIYGIALLGTVAALTAAATARHNYTRTRLGNLGALNLLLLDTSMLAAVALIAPHLVWPMVIAIPASLVRIGLTVQSLPKATRRHIA